MHAHQKVCRVCKDERARPNSTSIRRKTRRYKTHADLIREAVETLWEVAPIQIMQFIRNQHPEIDVKESSFRARALRKTSNILILFSTEAEMTIFHGNIIIRATIDGNATNPSSVFLTPVITEESFPAHRHTLKNGTYSFNFYEQSVSAGNYTIRIQWMLNALYGGTTGWVGDRTLIVLAFPTE